MIIKYMTLGFFLVVFQISAFAIDIQKDLMVDFRMDECYWLGGANGVTDDVKDSSGNIINGTSRNRADNTEADSKICRAGDFVNTYSDPKQSDAVYFPTENTDNLDIGKTAPFSVSAWVYRGSSDKWMAGVIRVSDETWSDGWGLIHTKNSGKKIDFFVGDYSVRARASLSNNTWTHIVGTYDGNKIRIYKNGKLVRSKNQKSYVPASHAVMIGDDVSGNSLDDRWQGKLDEVKIWGRVLSASEIDTIYKNENQKLNYDGSTRSCKTCDNAVISAKSWELVGIPADNRGKTVAEVFTMSGTYGTDWRVYRRDYSDTNNSSKNTYLAKTDLTEFGKGYWLGSAKDDQWDVSSLPEVTYDSHPDCVASKCVEIDLVPVSLDSNATPPDDLLGTGPYRNHFSGFVGLKKPVDWADCRFMIDDVAYTPKQAEDNNFASRQVWLYNPNGSGANNNGYTTCADNSPGGCKLVPFKGFSVELRGPTKNKTVKLLIPQE